MVPLQKPLCLKKVALPPLSNSTDFLYIRTTIFFVFQSNLINQIAEYVEMMPKTSQEKLLKTLKQKRALQLAKKIDAQKKPRLVISDQEIADIIHQFRKTKDKPAK